MTIKSVTSMIVGSHAMDYASNEDIQQMLAAHAATRTPEIEAVKDSLLKEYGPYLGETALYMVTMYKQGTTLDDLRDALAAEFRAVYGD